MLTMSVWPYKNIANKLNKAVFGSYFWFDIKNKYSELNKNVSASKRNRINNKLSNSWSIVLEKQVSNHTNPTCRYITECICKLSFEAAEVRDCKAVIFLFLDVVQFDRDASKMYVFGAVLPFQICASLLYLYITIQPALEVKPILLNSQDDG